MTISPSPSVWIVNPNIRSETESMVKIMKRVKSECGERERKSECESIRSWINFYAHSFSLMTCNIKFINCMEIISHLEQITIIIFFPSYTRAPCTRRNRPCYVSNPEYVYSLTHAFAVPRWCLIYMWNKYHGLVKNHNWEQSNFYNTAHIFDVCRHRLSAIKWRAVNATMQYCTANTGRSAWNLLLLPRKMSRLFSPFMINNG